MQTEVFIDWLRTQENPDKKQAMEKYMRNQFTFLGLQATERRKLSKTFLKEKVQKTKSLTKYTHTSSVDWKMLTLLWEQPEREFQLIGIDYLKHVQPVFVLGDLSPLRNLVLTKSWWDTVDFLAKNIGELVNKYPALIDEMAQWSKEENIWIRRVSILHQLAFKEATNTSLLQKVIHNNITDKEFFIQKAIGWALREYAKTNEKWVVNYVHDVEKELSLLSYREALKNIKEDNI